MSTKIYSIGSEKNVRSAAEEMARNQIGSLLVTQEGNYTGIITEVDIIRKVVAKGIDPAATTVRTVMTSPLITIEADRSVLDANDLMEQKKIRHIGVTRNGKIIGMVSIRDFLHPLSVEQPSTEQKASGF
ncbi:MAG: CBS domain-containing protein [Candidatus Manganitrophus sp.]|nr:CBS domain-containing protein [Candidatus Manganitrophus sp.]MDC4223340.1 CBS domain-containing protein [Candidatus Manganitrophus sp.]WDT71574.1 MAG: CBS domain-containing protein [Candidatus Manganitrophus sp.]WDT81088.1 MAG: CBS domain-containing protein [Candidatus Manganitrophus sp.]